MAASSAAWDVSAFLGPWPFRRLPDSVPEDLAVRLRREGIERAFVSPLAALFDRDPQPANRQWSAAASEHAFFRLVPVLDPGIPGWERDLVACSPELGGAAVRLHPNYHGYPPTQEAARSLVAAAGELGLPVILQLRMQDARAMHPGAQVPDVDLSETLELARRCPESTLIVGAAKWGEAQQVLEVARDLPRFYLEISHLEYVDGLHRIVEQYGSDRLLFGTHAPLFTPTAARLKVETARLAPVDREAILRGNALKLLG